MRRIKTALYATAIVAGLLCMAQPSQAVTPTFVIVQCPSTNPLIFSGSTTASASSTNFVTIRGNVSRLWIDGFGFATNDVTAVGKPPFHHSLVLWCNNDFNHPSVVGPVSGSAVGQNVINTRCPAFFGSFSNTIQSNAQAD